MQKRIDGKTASDTHSTSLRSAIRPVVSETPSEASSFRTEKHDPLASFEFGAVKNRQLPKMTQSQRPIFSKLNTKFVDIKTGLETISQLFERRLVESLRAVFLTSHRHRKQRRPSLPSYPSQAAMVKSPMQHRDLIKRNAKAQELLQSLPIKFKKKMNSMIDDYEKERVHLILQIKQLQCQPNESDYRNQLITKIKEVYGLCNSHEVLQNYMDQLNYIKKTILDSLSRIQSLEEEATSRQRANTQTQFAFQQSKALNQPSESKSLTKLIPLLRQTENSLNKFLMIPLSKQSIPRMTNQSQRSHSTSQSKINRSMAKSSVKGGVRHKKLSSENTSEQDSGEEQFGKEKVLQKKRIRRLFRAFLSSAGHSRKEAFQDLASEIGFGTAQCDSYSNLLC